MQYNTDCQLNPVTKCSATLIIYAENFRTSALQFLADRTNGRAIGTVLRLSVCL